MSHSVLRLTLIAAAVLAALPAHAAHAADVAETDAVLPVVQVTGQNLRAALSPSLAAEQERLARIPGGTNLIDTQAQNRLLTLGDALGYQPGLVVQEFFGGTDQPRLNIRGSGIQSNPVNRGVLLMQDSLPLNEADGSFILSLLEPRNTALVSVRRGSNADSASAGSLGGEVDFQSLTAAQDAGGIRAEGGSFGRRNLQGSIGVARDNVDAHLSVSHDEGDGYRHHSDSRRSAVQANVGLKLGNGVENRTYLNYTNVDFAIPAVLTRERALNDPESTNGDYNTPQDNLLNSYKRNPRREVEQWRLANRTRWGDSALNQEIGVYAQRTDDLFVDPATHNDTRSDTHGAQWQLDAHRGNLDYRLRSAWSDTSMRRALYANSPINGGRLQRFGNFDLDASNLDLLAGIDWTFAPAWRLSTELRASHTTRDAASRDSALRLDQDWNYGTPKVGVNWTPSAGQRWYANVSGSAEAPSYWEIVSASSSPAAPAAASAGLTRLTLQRATTAEIGGQGQFDVAGLAGKWSLSAYRSLVRDELISTTDANGLKVGTYNYAAHTRHQGVELGLDGALPSLAGSKLDYRLAWTFSDFTFRGGEFGHNQIAGVPRNIISAELMQRIGGWRFGPNLQWLTQDTPADHANTVYQPGYALLGLKADYQIGKWRAYVQIDNATDRRYISSYAIRNRSGVGDSVFLPGNGRSALAGVNYRF